MTVFTWPNVSHIVRKEMHFIFGTEGHLKVKVRHEILPQGVCGTPICHAVCFLCTVLARVHKVSGGNYV